MLIARSLKSLYTQSEFILLQRSKVTGGGKRKAYSGAVGGQSHLPVRGLWSKAREEEVSLQESGEGSGPVWSTNWTPLLLIKESVYCSALSFGSWREQGIIHTTEYYSATKGEKILTHATLSLNCEDMVLGDRKQVQKDKYYMVPLTWGP